MSESQMHEGFLKHEALKGLERKGSQSKKFVGFIAGLVAFLVLALAALAAIVRVAEVAPTADLAGLAGALTQPLTAVAWPMMLLILGYVGGTTWQERGVRIAALTGRAPPGLIGGKE